MAKRAKRASRANPRQERNSFRNDYTSQGDVGRTPRGNARNPRSNVIEFPQAPKKRHVEIIPRNVQQENLLASLENPNKHIVFAIGPAGCGKTLLATLYAIRALKSGQVQKIVITRPNVAVDDRDIGFLPGDILKKMTPWMMPILDVFADYYNAAEIKAMLEESVIEMVPIAFIRGRTFKGAAVIVDEAQGTTTNSMMSILTRIGEGSKMIVTGDLAQSDRGVNNGLADFVQRFTRSASIDVIEFQREHVERHKVIKELLSIYGDLNNN